MNPGLRRLYAPQPATVRTGAGGLPFAVEEVAVDSIREHWVVEDRWWIPQQLCRSYYELALADGRVVVVFNCAIARRWYRQRA